jgi:hypothetical protein
MRSVGCKEVGAWKDADSVSVRLVRADGFGVVEHAAELRSSTAVSLLGFNCVGVAIVTAAGVPQPTSTWTFNRRRLNASLPVLRPVSDVAFDAGGNLALYRYFY